MSGPVKARRTKTEEEPKKRKRSNTSKKFSKDYGSVSNTLLSLERNTGVSYEGESDKDSEGKPASRESILSDCFFDISEVLGHIPDYTDISLDSSIEEERLGGELKITPSEDQGRFVDPLYGSEEEAYEEQSSDNIESNDGIEEDDEEVIDDPDLYSIMDEDMQVPFGKDDENQFERLLEELHGSKADLDIPDVELLARETQQRELDAHTREFLEHLINVLVDEIETVDAEKILIRNLNKVQIVDKIAEVWTELQKERRVRQFLNRKVTDLYRRRKAFNKLSDNNPFTYEEDVKRYSTVLANLDSILSKEHVISEQIENKLEELRKELQEAEEKTDIAHNNLEELILDTVGRNARTRQSAALKIKAMRKTHYDLSKTRLSLIEKQHTEAVLRKKVTALEDISDDLQMKEYEYLQTEIISLNRKVEERNAELNKLRLQCQDDVHIHAHLREKCHMINATVSVDKEILQELIEQRKYDRQNLYNLKLKRNETRKKIEDLSFEAGLLDKPILMHDYDETVNKIKAKKLSIKVMKSKLTFLTEKINNLELNCPQRVPTKSKNSST